VSTPFDRLLADAIIGLDTLWGGDVMNPSGTGRFIADSWFSDEPLPAAYTHAAAARLRETGGVGAKMPDAAAVAAYLAAVDVEAAIAGVSAGARALPAPRRSYVEGMVPSLEVMWDLVLEMLGKGPPVPFDRCVRASCGHDPVRSDPGDKRARLAELLGRSGHPHGQRGGLLAAVEAWRAERTAPMASVKMLADAVIAQYDRLCTTYLAPHLPPPLRRVPRANIEFLPIRDAWFSGSMNYLGRARTKAGEPEYEATYEINASLAISVPEFVQLVTHEVVPGHVTTFAYLQDLYVRGEVGFEATVQTMNTRGAALSEGIANNGILIAYGVTEIDELPGEDLRIGLLLALLQDDAKNQSAYLTWQEGMPQAEVAAVLRRDFLVSEERADKLSGAWGRHPLLGRMYLPAYRTGTERVADLRRRYPAAKVLPVLYGCRGLVDVVTAEAALA
jgi:hypothetical protein